VHPSSEFVALLGGGRGRGKKERGHQILACQASPRGHHVVADFAAVPTGYDNYGYDKYGYDRYGYNKYSYDRSGYDKYGYNKEGYDKYGECSWQLVSC
jgi:hypothetical protein